MNVEALAELPKDGDVGFSVISGICEEYGVEVIVDLSDNEFSISCFGPDDEMCQARHKNPALAAMFLADILHGRYVDHDPDFY